MEVNHYLRQYKEVSVCVCVGGMCVRGVWVYVCVYGVCVGVCVWGYVSVCLCVLCMCVCLCKGLNCRNTKTFVCNTIIGSDMHPILYSWPGLAIYLHTSYT